MDGLEKKNVQSGMEIRKGGNRGKIVDADRKGIVNQIVLDNEKKINQ